MLPPGTLRAEPGCAPEERVKRRICKDVERAGPYRPLAKLLRIGSVQGHLSSQYGGCLAAHTFMDAKTSKRRHIMPAQRRSKEPELALQDARTLLPAHITSQ